MLEKLQSLLGKSIESEEIKSLFIDWRAIYPKSVYCTPDTPKMKVKMEKDCVRLNFGMGGNSPYLTPIPAKWEGGFIGIFTDIEFTKKRKGGIPFGVEFAMEPAELTAILGEPTVTEIPAVSTVWRKAFEDKYELVVRDYLADDGTPARSMHLSFRAV